MLDKPQTPAHFPTPAWAPDRWRLIERTARPYGLRLSDTRTCTDTLLTPLLDANASARQPRLQPA